jgi:hypothetical protein
MRIALLSLVAALCLPLVALAAPTGPRLPQQNLLKNPGAELGPVTPDTQTTPNPVPGWETTGGFHAVGYAGYRWAPAAADKTKGSGSKFFTGCLAPPGQTVNLGTATQIVPLGRWAQAIDAGTVTLRLSAELGGYNGTVNRALAEATFLNAAGAPVGKKIRLVGPTYLQRQGITRVEPRSATGAVPSGARQVRVKLTGSRAGSGPCGFVDNVGAVLGQAAK